MRSGERKGARGQERIDLTLFMFGKIIKYVFFFSFLESLIVHARWLFFRQDLSFNVPMSSPAWISFMGFRTFSVSLHFIQTRPPPHSAPAPNFPSHYHLLILSLSPYMFFSLLQDTTLLSVCTNRYMSLILYLYFLFYFLLSLSLLTPPPNPPPPPLPSSYYLTPPLYAILIFTRYNSFI